jgi:hypothetical protein
LVNVLLPLKIDERVNKFISSCVNLRVCVFSAFKSGVSGSGCAGMALENYPKYVGYSSDYS